MLESDYDAFCEVVVGFAELKGKALSPAAIKLYWSAMKSWDIADFRLAAEQLLMTCTFMPTPKDFEDLRKASRPLAAEAWARVYEFACRDWRPSGQHLRDPSVEFDEITLRTVATIGGFRAIAMGDSNSNQFIAKRFAENYDSLQDAQETREALPQIANGKRNGKLSGLTKLSGVLSRFTPPEDGDGD